MISLRFHKAQVSWTLFLEWEENHDHTLWWLSTKYGMERKVQRESMELGVDPGREGGRSELLGWSHSESSWLLCFLGGLGSLQVILPWGNLGAVCLFLPVKTQPRWTKFLYTKGMQVVGDVIFENLHIFLCAYSRAGFQSVGRDILMEPGIFFPQRKNSPLIKNHLPKLYVE